MSLVKNRLRSALALIMAAATASQITVGAFAEVPSSSEGSEHLALMMTETPSEYGYAPVKFVDENGDEIVRNLIPDETEDYGTLPASYDLRDYGRVTTVKNQGNTATCWAHAALAAGESSLITAKYANSSIDLSEAHLVWFSQGAAVSDAYGVTAGDGSVAFDLGIYAYDEDFGGGNDTIARSALNSGFGAALETSYPAVTTWPEISESYRFDVNYFLENSNMFAPSDRASIKSYLMTNGALTISYYYEDAYDNWKANGVPAYYYNGSENSNHAVTLVGWDDNYSASNFINKPAGNGAWLCKNSWSSSYGDNGCFWLSYYDTSITEISSMEMEPLTYNSIYQYASNAVGNVFNTYYAAAMGNIYTSDGEDPITAVAFQTSDASVGYTINIYSGVGATPTSGTLIHTQSGKATYAGLHTIPLTKNLDIASNTKFSVVVFLDKVGTGVFVDDYSDTTGRSFFGFGNSISSISVWQDACEKYSRDVYVKAFTAAETGAPANLKATANDSKVTLTWDKVSSATKYKIRRHNGTSWSDYKTVTTNSFTDTAVTNGTTYKYAVYAYANNMWGASSSVVSAKPFSTAVTNFKAVAGDKKVALSWTGVSGATKYKIRRHNGTAWSDYKEVKTTSFTDTAVTNGTTYKYAIYAYVNGSYGSASPVLSAKPAAATVSNFKATAGDKQVVLTWTGVSGATKYKIRRHNGTSWSDYKVVSATSFTDTAVTNGTTYKYAVYAYVGSAYGPSSTIISAKPYASVVSNFKAVAGDKKVSLSWSALSGATKYKIRRHNGTSWSDYKVITGTSFTDTSVTNGTTYKYAVYAYINGAYGGASTILSAKPAAAAPTNVKATAGDTKVTLSWSAVNGATKYKIRRHDGTSWSDLKVVSGTSYTDTTVTNGTTYKYAVYAYVGTKYGAASATVSAKPMAAVKNVKATATSGKITVTWYALSGASKYKVRRHNGTSWADYKTVTTTSLADTAVTAGTTYKYAVYAYVNGVWSPASATVYATAK